jgi:type I restriction enzyme S subunit
MSKVIQPKLRFPEFKDNWFECKLSDLLTFKNGINASKEDYGSGYKFINVLDIIQNDFITHDRIIGSVQIDESEFKKNIVEYGDILFQRSSETREEVGQANVYLDKDVPATFGGFVIRGKKLKEYDPEFMNVVLKTSRSRKEITSKSGGSTRYNVGQDTLSEVSIYTTDLIEQERIASFLRSFDDYITLLKRKKVALERYKTSVMQQIFSQKIRFKDENGNDFPDWEEKKLGDLSFKAQSGGTPKSTIKEYYNGDIPFLSISDMTSQGKYLNQTARSITNEGLKNSSSWIVPSNSLIYSMYASVGFVSINKIPIATSQAVMNIILKKEYDLEFVYYYLVNFQRNIYQYIETGTQGNINAQIVKNISVPVPSLKEQKRISVFLADIDDRIDLMNIEINQANKFKIGLFQKMFV